MGRRIKFLTHWSSRKVDMPQDGEINLKAVKAKYSVQDIVFVDAREIDFADEFRLTAEFSGAIGFSFLGAAVTAKENWLWVITAVFIGFSLVSSVRYLLKAKVCREARKVSPEKD